jgi:predicted MFS family arabinose efflux permease
VTGYVDDSTVIKPPRRIYFGWRIVLALFLVTFALYGVSIFSFIIFTQPLSHQFGWSPAQMGGLVSAMWLVAPLALFSGVVTTRLPAWGLIIFGLCVQAAVLASLGFVSELWQLYLLRLVMGLGKVVTITAVPIVVARWFSRRFATAMALVWAGGSAGGLVMAPLTEAVISAMGWKLAAVAIAAGLLAVVLLIVLLARGAASPEQLGLAVDGGLHPGRNPTPEPNAPAATTVSSGRRDLRAIHPLTAFFMFISVTGAGMAAIAVYTQEPSLLQGGGLSPAFAAGLLGLTAGGGLVGSVTIGWMLDRLHGLWSSAVVAGSVFVGLLAFVLLPHGPAVLLSVIGALGLGYGFGSGEVLWIALTKRQFGEALFPTTYGGWYFALQAGYAAGGSLAGWSFEHLGTLGYLGFVGLVYLPPAICSLVIRGAHQPAPLAAT